MPNSSLKFANLKVGLTVFAGLVALFIFLFLVGSEENFFTSTYHLKIFVTDVEGLADGSIVTLGGLKIGYVDGFKYAQKENINGVTISLNIPEKYREKISANSTAMINSTNILGDKVVDISMGNPGDMPLGDGDFLEVRRSLSLSDAVSELEPALKNFDDVMANLRTVTDSMTRTNGGAGRVLLGTRTVDRLEGLVTNLEVLSGAIAHRKGTLGKLVFDSTLYNNLNELSVNLNTAADSISKGKGTIGKLLMSDSLYNSVNLLALRLDDLVAKTSSDSSVVGGFFNDRNLYTSLNSLIKDINVLVKDMKEHPERYVHWSIF